MPETQATNLPLVYIIVLNWNGKADTMECLQSLEHIDYPNAKLLLVDNASTDDSVVTIREMYPTLEILQNKDNHGYAEGNNIGIRHALQKGAEHVVILNNDTVVDPAFASELVRVAEADSKVGIVGSKIYNFKTNVIQYLGLKNVFFDSVLFKKNVGGGAEDKGQFDDFTDVDCVAGCSMLIKATVLKKLAGFDQAMILYYEEVDLFMRAKRAGFSLKVAPKSKVWHKGGASANKAKGFVRYHISRNSFIFSRRHFNPIQLAVFLLKEVFLKIPFISLRILKDRDFPGLKDHLRGAAAGLAFVATGKIFPY